MNKNYNLVYPGLKDYYDVNIFNSNFSNLADGIDSVKSGGLKREVVVASYNTKNPYKEAADFVCTSSNAGDVIANAIEKCCEGGVILFLDGDYIIDKTVKITKTLTLMGYGAKTRFIENSIFDGYTMLYADAENITIKDISFEDNAAAIGGIHIITAAKHSIIIGGCDFTINRSSDGDNVAVLYTMGYKCRILMLGCYIRKHRDNHYIIVGRETYVAGVIMGNYCECIDDDTEIDFNIIVINSSSASKIRHAAQNTRIYIATGGEYNG